ncbi:MAG: hypothetical protein DRP84_04970 [Spirochaetes bacterium]|nr:MAG: hypothetical protein DRP84_04970 [Spirochaetota bacterium]RKX98116.1 MAG: hypothetical protein DRP55_08425 [Spirochaetota bacterium]
MKNKKAFTFIELLVILSIISIVAFLTLPRLATVIKPKRIEAFAYRLRDTLNYLNETAILKKKVYLFVFDLEEKSYYFRVSERGNLEGKVKDRYLKKVDFPDFLEIKMLKMQPGGEIREGRMIVPFTPKGILYPFLIDLSDGEREYVLEGNVVNSKIELKMLKREAY